jgi:NB-ARC domain/Domain of unknown function (DUF4062)
VYAATVSVPGPVNVELLGAVRSTWNFQNANVMAVAPSASTVFASPAGGGVPPSTSAASRPPNWFEVVKHCWVAAVPASKAALSIAQISARRDWSPWIARNRLVRCPQSGRHRTITGKLRSWSRKYNAIVAAGTARLSRNRLDIEPDEPGQIPGTDRDQPADLGAQHLADCQGQAWEGPAQLTEQRSFVAVRTCPPSAPDAAPGQPAPATPRECDIYVAVVGFRYGSPVPKETVSYTSWKFIEAGVAGLPRLVLLLDEIAEVPAGVADANRTAVEAFRQRLVEAGLTCAWFATVDGLELAAFQALKEWAGADARAVPRQLPPAIRYFAGRSGELAMLTGLLRGHVETGGTVVISAIGGTAGVGKTALAVYWAHQVADRFPDGQLYVNLRGFDPSGSVMDPAEAVRRFLDALGVPAERIPADPDAQATLYRSQLAGRRILVVLDNAHDTAQVRPLLPGASTCLVLVTSRNQLSGLVAADGAQPLTLDLLTHGEAQELLARRLDPDRLAAEPRAVEEIITTCVRLPLALAIVAAHAATHPQLPLYTLAAELRDARGRPGHADH